MSRLRNRETVGYRPLGLQELTTRRRRSFWALSTSIMAGNGQSEPPPPSSRRVHPAVREIHKNAWLKRQTSTDKKGTPFSKKGEKFWVVFCVHDDVEAFLEFYSEPKMGTIHKPLSATSINSCLHVSPSIVGQDNEYQFAVTLPTEVIRLVAANWEQMIEWVESLQGKLREMNILSPKDNLYSKLPELKPGTVASTRDPNSPLPPTPNNGQAVVLASTLASGASQRQSDQSFSRIEHLQMNTDASNSLREPNHRIGNDASFNILSSRLSVNGNTSATNSDESNQPQEIPNYDVVFGGSVQASSSSGGDANDFAPVQLVAKRKPKISVKVSVDVNNGQRTTTATATNSSNNQHLEHQQHRRQLNGTSTMTSTTPSSTTVVVIGNGDVIVQNNGTTSVEATSNVRNNGASSTASVTIRCSTSTANNHHNPTENQQESHHRRNRHIHRNNEPPRQTTWSEVGLLSQGNDDSATDNVTHSNGYKTQGGKKSKSKQNAAQVEEAKANDMQEDAADNSINNSTLIQSSSHSNSQKSSPSENVYEHIFLERSSDIDNARVQISNDNVKTRGQPERHSNGACGNPSFEMSPEEDQPPSSEMGNETSTRRMINGSNQRSVGRMELPATSNRTDQKNDLRRINDNMNGQVIDTVRSIGNSSFFTANDISNMRSTQLDGNPIDALIGNRMGEYRLRRNENSVGGRSIDIAENDNQLTNERSHTTTDVSAVATNTNVPLKEQQVIHLQMEINHPGGVRITLRKKDCINSIAFVDYLGAVWIAGWKQTQYPVLYYAFHVGDQILKVAGVSVQSSQEASRAIKMVSSMQVEFIVRRLPYGRVFALKRSRDGEPLGLVAEGGSGEISEVLPVGLAARYGLPPKGISLDGQSPCNWYLTEVNNRPLSLMSKENEVKDRLNAVGKEISILVQPADLVKHLRKSLKSYKGFRDYVVG